MDCAKQHAEFLTVTCLEWKHVLADDRFKDIITSSLTFLTKSGRVSVYAFVIMSNHFHLIWQIMGDHKRDDVWFSPLKTRPNFHFGFDSSEPDFPTQAKIASVPRLSRAARVAAPLQPHCQSHP